MKNFSEIESNKNLVALELNATYGKGYDSEFKDGLEGAKEYLIKLNNMHTSLRAKLFDEIDNIVLTDILNEYSMRTIIERIQKFERGKWIYGQ